MPGNIDSIHNRQQILHRQLTNHFTKTREKYLAKYFREGVQKKNRKKSGLLPNQVGVVSEGSKNPTPILESKMAKKDIKLVKKTR